MSNALNKVMYIAHASGSPRIEEVLVIHETPKTVTIRMRLGARTFTRRVNKGRVSSQVCETFDEAKAFCSQTIRNRLTYAKAQVESLEQYLVKAEKMEEG